VLYYRPRRDITSCQSIRNKICNGWSFVNNAVATKKSRTSVTWNAGYLNVTCTMVRRQYIHYMVGVPCKQIQLIVIYGVNDIADRRSSL